MPKHFVANNSQHFTFVVQMSKEKVHRARRSARWWKFSTLLFLSMTFCFCQQKTFCFCRQKSVEHFSSISNLFAKCRLKFRAAFLYQRVNIADIMVFSSRRSVEFSIDNLHLFAINLFSYWEYRLYFAFVSKTCAENFSVFFFSYILFPKCRWKFPSTFSFYQ